MSEPDPTADPNSSPAPADAPADVTAVPTQEAPGGPVDTAEPEDADTEPELARSRYADDEDDDPEKNVGAEVAEGGNA